MLSESIRGARMAEEELKSVRINNTDKNFEQETIVVLEDVILSKSEKVFSHNANRDPLKSTSTSIPSQSNDLTLSSEDSIFRTSPPTPYSVSAAVDSETRPSSVISISSNDHSRARSVLEEYIKKAESERKEKRKQLRMHALNLLSPPPLVQVERKSKGGVALSIDLSRF